MAKNSSSNAQSKKSEQTAIQPSDENNAKEPLYSLRSLSLILLVVAGLVTLATMNEGTRGLNTAPSSQASPVAAVKSESVVAAAADAKQSQQETAPDITSSEPVAKPTAVQLNTTSVVTAHTTSPRPLPPPSPTATPAGQPTPTVPQVPSVPPASPPPVITPPTESPRPQPKPHHDKSLLEAVDNLLSSLL